MNDTSRSFLRLTEASGGRNYDIWIDVDRIVAVRDCLDQGSYVYIAGVDPALVVESAAEILERLITALRDEPVPPA